MKINEKTSIAAILSHRPEALNTIVKLAPGFNKLKNPIIRKLMAGRTSIGMAADIGNVNCEEFFRKLEPLGFTFDMKEQVAKIESSSNNMSISKIDSSKLRQLDVRPILDAGNDPLKIIMNTIRELPEGYSLQIINTFVPHPLIKVLAAKGFSAIIDDSDPDAIVCTFHPDTQIGQNSPIHTVNRTNSSDFQKAYSFFEGKSRQINVRHLEIPLPMTTIIESLLKLEDGKALHVLHKKYPVYLIPEIEDMGFRHVFVMRNENETELLIYRKDDFDHAL